MELTSLNRLVAKRLLNSGLTLGVAESCTGGLLADTITDLAGSSAYFKGGLVAYRPEVKIKCLQIDPRLLEEQGVVSEGVALAMAGAARRVFVADLGVGITGVAGPGGGSPAIPVGRVYIAVEDGVRRECRKFDFKGTRLEIKRGSAGAALAMLEGILGAV